MYEHFVKFIGKGKGPNRFWRVSPYDINEAESRLGVKLPSDLRSFFLEVGSGFWAQGAEDRSWDRSLVNRIPSPIQIADLVGDEESAWRPPEGLVEGAIPFFDLGENTYLIVSSKVDSPSRVYWPNGTNVVTENLRDFFEKLQLHAGFFQE